MIWDTKLPLIAILRGIKTKEINSHISALIDSGFHAVEIPLNSPNWEDSIALAAQLFSNKALIGAGTVVKPEQVDILANIGCQLIVTPNVNPLVIKKAILHNMIVCSGCATATEAFSAIEAGAQNLKIFPSSSFSPSYIKALKVVLPKEIPIFAVGGITPDNLHEYIEAGCIGAGLGNDLYRAGQSSQDTEKKAKVFIDAYTKLKNK